GAELDLVDRQELDRAVERHRFNRANEIGRVRGQDLLLPGDQRDSASTPQFDDPVVILPRQQAQREADHAALMIEHALDREVGLAGVGRPEDRDEPRFGTQHGHDACIGSEALAGKSKWLKKPLVRHCGSLLGQRLTVFLRLLPYGLSSLVQLKRPVMNEGRRRGYESLLETYCSQMGTLLARPVAGLAFINAKQNAEAAATAATQQMVQAQASDRAKTKFLANMSHELRTPLNAIIGFSEVIKLNAQQPKERYPEYAQYIHDAAIHLLELINGILDLARIEAGKVELEEEAVSAADLIYSAVTTVRPLADKKLVAIDCRHRRIDVVIRVDQTKFKQVLLNLLSNAVKF